MTLSTELAAFLGKKETTCFVTNIAGEVVIFRKHSGRMFLAPSGRGIEYLVDWEYLRRLQKEIDSSTGKTRDQFLTVLSKITEAKKIFNLQEGDRP